MNHAKTNRGESNAADVRGQRHVGAKFRCVFAREKARKRVPRETQSFQSKSVRERVGANGLVHLNELRNRVQTTRPGNGIGASQMNSRVDERDLRNIVVMPQRFFETVRSN